MGGADEVSGREGIVVLFWEMVVDARLSARSEVDNSLDRVRLIFLDGD